MSRRSLIICASVLAAMALVIGLAIFFLFPSSNGNAVDERSAILSNARYRALTVIPSDAMLVSCLSSAECTFDNVLGGFPEVYNLLDGLKNEGLTPVLKNPLTISLHYSGKVNILFVFDLTNVSDDTLEAYLQKKGLYTQRVSGFLLTSTSDSLVKSGARHFEQGLCVLDAPGFVKAFNLISADDFLLISNAQARHLTKSGFSKEVFRHAGFFESFAQWTAIAISSSAEIPVSLSGRFLSSGELHKFISVFSYQPQVSHIAEILPAYTVFAASVPLPNMDAYVSGYEKYKDSKQQLQAYRVRQQALADATGISPKDFFYRIAAKEVGKASFLIGKNLESVNLIKVGNEDYDLLPSGMGNTAPSTCKWKYAGFVSSVFGDLFQLEDETYFTYIGGWIITGSKKAVDEYAVRGAYNYTLAQYMEHAGKSDLLGLRPTSFVAYISFTEKGIKMSDYLKSDMNKALGRFIKGAEYAPGVLTIAGNGTDEISFDIYNLSLTRTKAPTYDRDTAVEVPQGQFIVKNSHTGKKNTFYQNSSLAICLRDEKGRDLWGVPLGKPICGTAHNVDFYANGKLQIIFGAGSQIYIIDRLGRYVTGFPLDLKKEITIGPDIYDFSGARKYNIMVLHDDNTIQMYNLKGETPKAWKGITANETIKCLHERLIVKGSDFWVVRTSVQTLIFPFYGGKPITNFSGDNKIRPDSPVSISGGSVKVNCYDGKTRTVKLK